MAIIANHTNVEIRGATSIYPRYWTTVALSSVDIGDVPRSSLIISVTAEGFENVFRLKWTGFFRQVFGEDFLRFLMLANFLQTRQAAS